MLSFTQVSSTGFTWHDGIGNSVVVVSNYNNETNDGHLLYKNNALYEIFVNRYTIKSDKSCNFVATQPLQEWIIKHNLNRSTVVLTMLPDGRVVYPTKVIETSFNETKIIFTIPILGSANVRPT